MSNKKWIIGIIGIVLIIFVINIFKFISNLDKKMVDLETKNEITDEDEAELEKVNVMGYHLVTYNQSANTNSFLKTLTVKMEQAETIRFVIGSIEENGTVVERMSFEKNLKKGENELDLLQERHLIKQGEYLLMDVTNYNILYQQQNATAKSLVQNENNKSSGQMIMTESDYLLPFHYTLEKVKEYNALAIGNDITTKNGGTGLNATDEQHDYYHLTKARLENTFETVNMNCINAQDWEKKRLVMNRKDWLKKNLKQDTLKNLDLVIFQLGDHYTKEDDFEAGVIEMVEHVRSYSPNAEMIWMGLWFEEETRQNALPGICERLGIHFVNLSDLAGISDYQSLVKEQSEAENYVELSTMEEVFYPNNEAMQIISNRIMEILKFDF